MESIHILLWPYSVGYQLFIYMFRQRKLNNESVYPWVIIQLFDLA